jgi:hypothetical protein
MPGSWKVQYSKPNTAGYKGLLFGIRRYGGKRCSALFVYEDALLFTGMPIYFGFHWSAVQSSSPDYLGELRWASDDVAPSGSKRLTRYLGSKSVPIHVIEGELSVQWEGRKLWLSVSGNPKGRITGSHRALNQLALLLHS